MRNILFCVLLLAFSLMQAQSVVKTSVSAIEAVEKLTNSRGPVSWSLPVSDVRRIPFSWSERESSLGNEGVRIFVGRHNGSIIATLSIFKGKVSADTVIDGGELEVRTSEDGFLVIINKQGASICGSYEEGGLPEAGSSLESTFAKKLNPLSKTEMSGTAGSGSDGDKNALRIYRLALPVAYNAFEANFGKNEANVKQFWARAEVYLNEMYTRDIGIKFQVINDEKLISKDKDADPFKNGNSPYLGLFNARPFLGKTIGDESYDLGVFIAILSSRSGAVSGIAQLSSAYGKKTRASASSGASLSTVAHEIGHMFGGNHTFTIGSNDTNYSEPGRGTSVMSYGSPKDFFSLVSIQEILEKLNQSSYYSDEDRKTLVKVGGYSDNYPYGIKSTNRPPAIDRSRLKTEYTIPKETFFQFVVHATDPDGDKLLYAAHQADKNKTAEAQFRAFAPADDNTLTFQPKYLVAPHLPGIPKLPNTGTAPKGTYTFLLGVSDGGNKSEDHHTLLDMEKFTMNIIEGVPFKITSPPMEGEYWGGEKVELKWSVDKTIFPEDSKVRILLSDDFGKTFKYVLKEGVPNNGISEVELPNIAVGKIFFKDSIDAGVIKIEVMDNPSYALTEVDPQRNGFRIAVNPDLPVELSFVEELPKDLSLSCGQSVPEKALLTARGGCSAPEVVYTENKIEDSCPNSYTLLRKWTASNNCGGDRLNTISHEQRIMVSDTVAPEFNEPLPAEAITLNHYDPVPEQTLLTATDNCSTTVTVVATKEETLNPDGGKTILYKWSAKDDCNNEKVFVQTITVKVDPTLSTGEIGKQAVQKITVAPNPSNGNFKISLSLGNPEPVKMRIYDMEGRQILPEKTFVAVKEHEIKLDVKLSSGIYIMVLETPSDRFTEKLIIRK